MPLNETQFRVAKALNKKQQDRLWGLADREDTGFDDPEYVKTANAFKDTSEMIRGYEASTRKVDETGKLTAPPETRLPATVEAPNKPQGQPGNPVGYNYFFEPSIAEVKTLLRKRPEVVKRLKLDQLVSGISSPEKTEPVLDPMSGMQMGENRVAARTHLDDLTTDDSQYKDIADYLWQERADEARAKGIELQRYRDVPLKGHVPDFLAGGAIYNIERRLTPAVLGATDAMTLGLASPAGDYLTEKIGDAANAVGIDIGPQPTAEDVRNRSEGSYLVGNAYGYGMPGNPTNALQKGMYDQGIKAAGKFGGNSAVKAGVAAVAGGSSNAIEGAVGDVGRELGEGKSLGDATKTAVTGMPMNWLVGGVAGGAADLAGQVAESGRKAIRSQDHLMMPLKALREGGGDTHMGWGVVAPPEVHEHINSALEDGAVGSPAARAADVVAPRIQESLERQDAEATQKVGSQMEEYYAHPKYNNVRVSSKPLVRALVDMISEGRFHAPVTGAPAHMDQDAVRTIQNEVVRHKWAEMIPADPAAAAKYADEVDGIVVDLDTATDIFGKIPDETPQGWVAVIVPKHMTAKELTRFEEKVYGKLKPGPDGARVESPVYEKLDRAAKEVRDKFEYYVDDEGRLVDPPDGAGSPPSSVSALDDSEFVDVDNDVLDPEAAWRNSPGAQRKQGSPSSPNSAGPQRRDYPNINEYLAARQQWRGQSKASAGADLGPATPKSPSTLGEDEYAQILSIPPGAAPPRPGRITSPETRPSSSTFTFTPERIAKKLGISLEEAEKVALKLNGGRSELPKPTGTELDSSDFIPSHEELNSDDFLGNSAIELDPADVKSLPDGKPTPRLRDLRRRSVNKGPQKNEYDNHNDYLMARARWRFQSGKPTAGDKVRLKKAVEAVPPTERIPGSADTEAPTTKRSISPPDEEATPLSLLAGNKLAMEVPEEKLFSDSPDESLPAPMAKDWAESNKETKEWYDDIVSPGRDPRSDEAKRMGDLTAQKEAHEAAEGQVRNVEDRLGPMEPEDRMKAILGVLSKKLGREVTKEDLIRAGLITGGAAAMFSDDENVQGTGAMVGMMGGGKKSGFPRQLEAKLDDGTVVKGFSALRRKQHDLKTGVETAKRRVGASNEKTVKDRVMEYNLQDNIDFDRELLAEAKKLGLEKELRIAAATRVYPKLHRQAWGGSNKGSLEGLASFFGLRGDKLLELLSGTPRNPFDRSTNRLITDNFREQLNLRGGRVGARHGDDIRKALFDEDEDSNASR